MIAPSISHPLFPPKADAGEGRLSGGAPSIKGAAPRGDTFVMAFPSRFPEHKEILLTLLGRVPRRPERRLGLVEAIAIRVLLTVESKSPSAAKRAQRAPASQGGAHLPGP